MERKKILMEKEKDINRIKVVLVEKKRTNKWLAEQLGKDPATVSKVYKHITTRTGNAAGDRTCSGCRY